MTGDEPTVRWYEVTVRRRTGSTMTCRLRAYDARDARYQAVPWRPDVDIIDVRSRPLEPHELPSGHLG